MIRREQESYQDDEQTDGVMETRARLRDDGAAADCGRAEAGVVDRRGLPASCCTTRDPG